MAAVAAALVCVGSFGSAGAQCIDYSDYLHWVGSVDTTGEAHGVAVLGTYAFVADGPSGLRVIDITNPQSPQIEGGMDTPDYAFGVAVSGTYAYVGDGYSGLQVLPAQCEPASGVGEDHRVVSKMLLRTYPNPASGMTRIQFATRKVGLVKVSVYDLAGRRVRGLTDRILNADTHDLLWDGRDQNGRAVPAGVYLVRVSTVEESTTARIVMVR